MKYRMDIIILSRKAGQNQLERFRKLVRRYRTIVSYFMIGVLTTLVNYLVYLPLYNICGLSAGISNVFAWFFSVVFAFLTNKSVVFQSHDWSAKTALPELVKFLGTRLGSGLIETVIIVVCVDMFGWDGNAAKLVTGVLVVIMNYAASKLLVFGK